MANILGKFAILVTLLVLMAGVGIIVNTAHELGHYFDLRDEVKITNICILNIPFTDRQMVGYVEYETDNEVDHAATERVAMTVMLIIFVFLSICISYTVILFRDRKEVKQ